MKIHITEHKSVEKLNSVPTQVRVFVNFDFHYGYFVDEHLLFSLLTAEQQNQYLKGPDAQLDVAPEVAQRIIDEGHTIYAKPKVV